MTIFVEVTDEPIAPGGIYVADGVQKIRPGKQNAYLHQGASYPTPFKVDVDEKTGPLRPGRYLLAGSPFQPGQYGLDFRAKQLRLVPLEEALSFLNTPARPVAKVA